MQKDGIGGGLGEQGWYPPAGGNGPVAEMAGRANGWVDEADQIAVGPHDGKGVWMPPIGAIPQGDFGPLAVGTQTGDTILSAVRSWDTYWHAERWGGDNGLG